jgi:ribosomal protein S18 acetylase RimI-like enzyme
MTMIREAAVADAALLVPLLAEFNEEASLTVEQLERRLAAMAGTEKVLLAFVDDEAVGFVSVRIQPFLSSDRPYAEVTELFVRPDMRRRGIATALMERATALAEEQGATSLLLLTGFKNEGAQAFYRSIGYEEYCLAMRLRLPRA